MMDDEAFAASADANAARLRQAADKETELTAIFAEHAAVYGLYPDPESITRWEKFLLKGAADAAPVARTTACLWCRSIEDAIALARTYGDQD